MMEQTVQHSGVNHQLAGSPALLLPERFISDPDLSGRIGAPACYELLSSWGERFGLNTLAEAAGLQNSKGLWSRQSNGYVYSFRELCQLARRLGVIKQDLGSPQLLALEVVQEIREAWLKDCAGLGRPKSVATLVLLAEARGMTLSTKSFADVSAYKVPYQDARKLFEFAPIPWTRVQTAVGILVAEGYLDQNASDELQAGWNQELELHFSNTYETKLIALAAKQKIENVSLAAALELGDPEKKGRNRVNQACRHGDYKEDTPPGVFAYLIGESEEEVLELLEQKRVEIRASCARMGLTVPDAAGTELVLWGVKKEPNDTVESVRQRGEQIAAKALARWLANRDYTTVVGGIQALINDRGIAPLATLVGSSQKRIKSIADEKEVPSWPEIKSWRETVGLISGIETERDWHDRISQDMISNCDSDLVRALDVWAFKKANSRNAVLTPGYTKPQGAGRFYATIAATGTCSPKALSEHLKKIGLAVDSPEGIFVELVRETGWILTAIPRWEAVMAERDERELLGALAELRGMIAAEAALSVDEKSNVSEQSVAELLGKKLSPFTDPKQAKQQDAAITRLLSSLPGATARELLESANSELLPPHHEFFERIRALLPERELSAEHIPYLTYLCQPAQRRPLLLHRESFDRELSSQAVPIGVLAHLAAKDEAQQEELLNLARSSARGTLQMVGITPTELLVAKHIWGDGTPIAKATLDKVAAVQTKKTNAALDQLHKLQSSRSVVQVWQVLIESAPGGTRKMSESLSLSLSGPTQISEGKIVPTLAQHKQAVSNLNFVLLPAWELGWQFSIAQYFHDEGKAPIGRVLCSTAFALHNGVPLDQYSKLGRDERVFAEFLAGIGLSQVPYRNAMKKGPATPEAARDILREAGFRDQHQPRRIFANSVAQDGDVRRGIAKALSSSSGAALGSVFKGVVEELARPEDEQAITDEMLQFIKTFCGATASELTEAYGLFAMTAASIRNNETKTWITNAVQTRSADEARLDSLVKHLDEGEGLSFTNIRNLFPDPWFDNLDELSLHLPDEEIVWYVAALQLYNRPWDALGLLVANLKKRKMLRDNGYEFRRKHQLQAQGSLLAPSVMNGFFAGK